MKKLMKMLMTAVMCLSLVACVGEDDGKVKIGVIQYAQHPALDESYEGFMDALEAAGYSEENVVFDIKNASGDQGNCETIADKFVNDGNDLIYAIATPAAQAVAAKTTSIPVVISAVTDPATSGLVDTNEKPGGNVTGVSDLTPVKEQIALIKEMFPNAKKIAIMYCSAEDNSIFQADIAKKEAKKNGLDYVEATVSDSNQIQQVTESLIGKVDAIYIPTDNLLAEGMATVAMVANDNNLPCIVGESGMAANGGVASVAIDYYQLGKRAGEMAVKILKGEAEPATMPIEYQPNEECTVYVNMSVVKQLNLTIPQSVLDKAKTIK